ncbi:MAG TPA: VOC family protein [Stackebrandtia sp.]|uniref:VOC family protein n=1 Tax=Stackebrandtia sp. TaxID=2023065 RepID=UPI002D573008|nr:VOC family protein [Stackebrandtia sp.]HZE37622.1 VOC family protein [Stackebrandtia sp.]
MASRWFSTVFDARDHGRLARWWAEVLDYEVIWESVDKTFIADRAFPKILVADDRRVLEGPQPYPGMLFMAVPDDKERKNRVHIDISPDDQATEVERLVNMGARHVDIGQRDVHWVVLADPEGNEFCVMTPIDSPPG